MVVIDLHCHTTASDGLVAPAALVRHAAERNVDVIAITDHDTVAGVGEATVEAEDTSVRVVPGIELSTRHEGREVHVLGYFVDPESSELSAALTETRAQREDRARLIVERLRGLGYSVTFEDVRAQAGGDVVARPHIARALVALGYVPDVRSAFTAAFIGEGGRAFIPREAMSTIDAIELVRRTGGVSVIAHPGVSHHDGEAKPIPDEVLRCFAEAGVSGLEVDHPDHPPLIRDRIRSLASELGLVCTGGSDWHGEPEHSLGRWRTTEENFRRLEESSTAGG